MSHFTELIQWYICGDVCITFEWLLPPILRLFSLYRRLCALLETDTHIFDGRYHDQSEYREVTEQARQSVVCLVWFS